MTIQTIPQSELPALGTELADGRYGGLIMKPDGLYAIVDLGRAFELKGEYGCYGIDVIGARSTVDSKACTEAMAAEGSEIALEAIKRGALIAARDPLEQLYRIGKPTTQPNYCTFRDGDNPGSVPPGFPYTAEFPGQTIIPAYLPGGDFAFDPVWYLSSTQCGPFSAYGQYFGNGYAYAFGKGYKARVRLVREIKVIQ